MNFNPESLVAALRSRGLELRLTGNKLQVFDAEGRHAWPALQPDEQAFIRAQRQQLKSFLKTGTYPHETTVAEPETPTVEPPVAPLVDLDAECKANNLLAWRAIHFNDPEEIERRAIEATEVMFHQLGKTSPYL